VVNLSLLNTDWYIQQLRDEQPKLPVQLSDDQIQVLGGGYVPDSLGRPAMYTNEFMVHHLLGESRAGSGWIRQPYFAVTVPEHYGYDANFSLQGLVYEVNRDTLHPRVDVAATANNLHHVFLYRGLFRPDGSWDASVYKDENAATLSRNYASAYVQLGLAYHDEGRIDEGIRELNYASRMFPDLDEVQLLTASFYNEQGDSLRAAAIYRELVLRRPQDAAAHNYYGVSLVFRDSLAAGLHEFDEAIRLEPGYPRPYYSAYYALARAGQTERALAYLQRLLDAVPDEEQARAILSASRPQAGALPPPGAMPPPATSPFQP
jgi:tetratricopeptide (TPR) repeat protein